MTTLAQHQQIANSPQPDTMLSTPNALALAVGATDNAVIALQDTTTNSVFLSEMPAHVTIQVSQQNFTALNNRLFLVQATTTTATELTLAHMLHGTVIEAAQVISLDADSVYTLMFTSTILDNTVLLQMLGNSKLPKSSAVNQNTASGSTAPATHTVSAYHFDNLVNCTYTNGVLAYTSGDLQSFMNTGLQGYVAASVLKNGQTFNVVVPDLPTVVILQFPILNSTNQIQAGAAICQYNDQLTINGHAVNAGDVLEITIKDRGFIVTSKGAQVADSGQVAGTDALQFAFMMITSQSDAVTLPSFAITAA